MDLGAADEDSEDCEKNFDASHRPSAGLSLNYDQEEDVQESERARNEARVGVAKLAATVNNQAIAGSIREASSQLKSPMVGGPKSLETREDVEEAKGISLQRAGADEEQKAHVSIQKIKTDYEDIESAKRNPAVRLSQTSKSAEHGAAKNEAHNSINRPAINQLDLAAGEEEKGPTILLANQGADPYEAVDMLANTGQKHLPVASSAEFSQRNSDIEGIIEPLHKPIDVNNKSEIVSELSRIQSESQFNFPQLDKPNLGAVYFTGVKENPKD